MNILRKMFISLLAGVLSFALLGLAWSNVALATIHNRDTVKNWFNKSDFYNKVADIAVTELSKPPEKQEGQEENEIPNNDPQVQAVVKQALNADFLKTNVEKVLDATYNWLDSSSDRLDFTIDLSPVKQQIADGLSSYAKSRVESLPVCSSGESADNFDAFNATCRPKAVKADQVAQQVSSDLLNGDGFLSDSTFTAEDFIFKNQDGKPVLPDQQPEIKNIKRAYGLADKVLYAFSGLALLAALGIVLISRDHLKGVRRVGFVLLTSGAILLITFFALGAVSNWADKQLVSSPDKSAAQKELGADLLRVVFTDIKAVIIKYAVVFLVLGLAAVLARTLLHHREHHAAVAKGEKSPDEPIHVDEETPDSPNLPNKDSKKTDDKES